MNNLSSYCGLVDAKIRASDKDLPVHSVTPKLTHTKKEKKKNELKIQSTVQTRTKILAICHFLNVVA